MASGGTWADRLATRQRTLETFAPVFRERDSMRRALSRTFEEATEVGGRVHEATLDQLHRGIRLSSLRWVLLAIQH